MPSTAYSAELRPDPVLRRFVLGTGAVLGLLGCIAVLTLPWPPLWRAIAAVTWAGSVSWELARLRLAWRDCMAFRLGGDGSAAALGRDGHWRPATLLADGVLVRRWGWIRLRSASGRVYAERLQVIWRHVGAHQ